MKSRFVSGKKLLFTLAAIICFSGAFAQEKSVVIVRHINAWGKGELEQRLLISRSGQEMKEVSLKQKSTYYKWNEGIAKDDQSIIEIFEGLINEGYELKTSNSSAVSAGTGREIIYIFVKD